MAGDEKVIIIGTLNKSETGASLTNIKAHSV